MPKTLDLDAIKTAVEPYLAQAKGYGQSVSDRAESLLDTAKKDPRFAKAFDTAEQITGVVVDTVQQRVVQPVMAFAARGAAPAPKPGPRPAPEPEPAADTPDEPTEQ